MECHFPAGPLIGDVTFTRKANGTIDVVDRDNDYNAVLYRCPKKRRTIYPVRQYSIGAAYMLTGTVKWFNPTKGYRARDASPLRLSRYKEAAARARPRGITVRTNSVTSFIPAV
jgi:hypothetical protein